MTRIALIFCMAFSACASFAKTCELPASYKAPHKTFVINEEMSCGANILIHAMPTIAEEATKQLSSDELKNPNAVGRLAYRLIADRFTKAKHNIKSSDFTVAGKESAIPVRLYEGAKKNRFILFAHGGGWTRGDLHTHDVMCRKLSEITGASVLAVDYRLAPEHPYPAGLDDLASAYDWLLDNNKDAKIFVAGDSGGGNLAAALAVKLIQEDKHIPDGAILIYPSLDLRVPEKTTDPYARGYLLERAGINTYVHNYLGEKQDELAKDPLVSPLLATDVQLKKFPWVILVSAQYDPLTAESHVFAKRLKKLGVRVKHKVIPKTIHIFAQFPDLFPEAAQAYQFIQKNFTG